MLRGLSAIPGVPLDVAGRMSLGNLIPATGVFLKSKPDKAQEIARALGPIGGLAQSATKALKGDALGLAPVVIRDIYASFPRIRAGGASVIVVDQDIGQAMKVADRVYCMMEGRVTLQGAPGDLSREAIHAAYFGAVA